MKSIAAAALVVAATSLLVAEEPTTNPPADRDPAAPPVVRVSMPETAPPADVPPIVIPAVPLVRPGSPTSAPPPADGVWSSSLGWSSDTMGLRSPGSVPTRTNRVNEPRGVVPRLVKPERRGVGGFLAGFANLFNPFAPSAQGVAVGGDHWYDAQLNPAPLPRGLRDERFHEPRLEVLSLGLEGPIEQPADTAKPAEANR